MTGIFDANTETAVRAFQSSRGLVPTGVVDAPTWDALVVEVGPFSINEAVAALQRELRDKRGATGGTDGVYGSETAADGQDVPGPRRACRRRASPTPPRGARSSGTSTSRPSRRPLLCDYDPPANANWGTAETISTIEAAGAAMVKAGYGRVAVGDLSYEHGGDHPEHETHEVGLDADIRPMRKANDQCSHGSNWRLAAYDRAATRALIKAIRAATPGHVKEIFFNDPQLIREGLTVFRAGHDDHLHVRLCEAHHPVPLYRC